MLHHLNNYFLKEKDFSLNIRDVFLFIVSGTIVWLINWFSRIPFPSENFIPHFARTTISAAGAIIMIFVSIRLLKRANVPANSLGLKLSGKSFFSFIAGILLGLIAVFATGFILYVFVPYHFEAGPLQTADVLKEAHSYFGHQVSGFRFLRFFNR